MSFEIYLKRGEGNQIGKILGASVRQLNAQTLTVSDGFLKVGAYYVPFNNILFVKEV